MSLIRRYGIVQPVVHCNYFYYFP